MAEQDRRADSRSGFTLVETLVTIFIVSILVAFVYPVVVQQINKWEALRMARDLANLRTSIQSFNANTLAFPLYLTQMAVPITAADSGAAWHVEHPEFRSGSIATWNGPYLDATLTKALRIDDAFKSGYGGRVLNDLYCYDAQISFEADCSSGKWLAIRVEGLVGEQFDRINEIIDPGEPLIPGPTGNRQLGRLRFVGGDGIDYALTVGTMYYLAIPYTR